MKIKELIESINNSDMETEAKAELVEIVEEYQWLVKTTRRSRRR